MQSRPQPSQLGMFRVGADTLGMLSYIGNWITSFSFNDISYRNPNIAKDAPNRIGVYCVHGIFDRPTAFSSIALKLLKTLPESITSINMVGFDNWSFSAIETSARELAEKVLKNGDKDIILLGHSRGGLVAAYFAEYLSKKYGINVHTVIPICTPFEGSYLAAWARPLALLSDSVKEIQPDSAFLTDLRNRIKDSDIRYFFCGAEKDGWWRRKLAGWKKLMILSLYFLSTGTCLLWRLLKN